MVNEPNPTAASVAPIPVVVCPKYPRKSKNEAIVQEKAWTKDLDPSKRVGRWKVMIEKENVAAVEALAAKIMAAKVEAEKEDIAAKAVAHALYMVGYDHDLAIMAAASGMGSSAAHLRRLDSSRTSITPQTTPMVS